MEIKVFKFGGSSIMNVERMNNVANILKEYPNQKMLVVMSALGKTTNKIEQILLNYHKENLVEAKQHLDQLKAQHYTIVDELFSNDELKQNVKGDINDLFVEIEWILEEDVSNDFDFDYDQMVSIGEFLSTKIMSHLLREQGLRVKWMDVRDVLRTDQNYRDARVNWELTQEKIKKRIPNLLEDTDVVLTQGFIGCAADNTTTTLGREGSDYTASIFSYCLDVASVTIWKDVSGILTGDPKKNENVDLIPNLSFREAIEMTYYGAKVIHPKTIKPLQNKSIPLVVRSFLSTEQSGTTIKDFEILDYPAITVFEENQVLVSIITNDFSFIAENHLSDIFNIINEFNIKIRLMRNSAVSFILSIINPENKLDKFIEKLSDNYKVSFKPNLTLITIRHYNDEIIKEKLKDKIVVFEERYQDTIQYLVEQKES